METSNIDPLTYVNRWFTTPIKVAKNSVLAVIEALDQHPSADDQTAQNYVMPPHRCREQSGRFRIWGENQDCFY